MVIKDRYVSKYITKYQRFGIAVISVRKKVLPPPPNGVMILENFVLSYSMKFGFITKLYSLVLHCCVFPILLKANKKVITLLL